MNHIDPQTLLDLCSKANIARETVLASEVIDRWYVNETVLARDVKTIDEATISRCADSFGHSMTFSISIGSSTLLSVVRGQLPPDIEVRLTAIQDIGDQTKMTLEASIDKQAIASELTHGASIVPLFYIFEHNAVKLLGGSLVTLDQQVFVSDHQPLVLWIADSQVSIAGNLLRVQGLQVEPSKDISLAIPDDQVQIRLKRFRQIRSTSLNWAGFDLERITPEHFLCPSAGTSSQALAEAIRRQLLTLLNLYTANRSVKVGDEFEAEYSSSDRSVKLRWNPKSIEWQEDQDALEILALWPYTGDDTNRLALVQNTVARTFQGEDAISNHKDFNARLRIILDGTRWQHRLIIDKKIDTHFEEVEKVFAFAEDASSKVSDTIDSMVKSVAETMLAAIATVVAALLGSLVEGKTQDSLFAIVLRGYGWYTLLVAGVYRIGSLCWGYVSVSRDANEKLDRYKSVLGDDRVKLASEPYSRRKKWFWFWFAISSAIIIGLAIASFWFADKLPAILVQQGLLNAQLPTPTPTTVFIASPTPLPIP